MTMYDLIMKKKRGGTLTDEEIAFWIDGVTNGSIPAYQTSALLMAICFQGLSPHETAVLTDCMMHSGDTADLSAIAGWTVDKHSTGGVGDKTTLVVAPLAAACGLKVAKMSGRGLGHTGGTVDKLESIDGFRTILSPTDFTDIVNTHGLCVIAQSGDLAPADKILYSLRDVTGTVDNLSLIASSIMSKKLAGGAKALCLDVKVGSGAFMKTTDEAIALAKAMVDIGVRHGRRVQALITDMDRPLGYTIGNAMEVQEAIDTLEGHGPADLTELSLAIVTTLLTMTDHGDEVVCRRIAEDALASGKALEKLRDMIAAQGGDATVIDHPKRLPKASCCCGLIAQRDGYIAHMNTEEIGQACTLLGAGRQTAEDTIDMSAGICLLKKTGDFVKKGEAIATLYSSNGALLSPAVTRLADSLTWQDTAPAPVPLITAVVTAEGVTYL